MERKLVLWILGLTLMALGVGIFLIPGRAPDPDLKLPWRIEPTPGGGSRVFGLTLGESTLSDARHIFQDQGTLDLLEDRSGRRVVEAYFERVILNGLRADFVLSLAVPRTEVDAMYDQGLRVSTLASGVRKVELRPEDAAGLASAPVEHITYLPKADLDADLLRKRFGSPRQRIREPDQEIEHWLYPHRGLDIAYAPEGQEVFQYVRPADFERLILRPLQAARRTLTPDSGSARASVRSIPSSPPHGG